MPATTLDPNNKTSHTLSGGNLVGTSTGAGGVLVTRPLTGKHYFEGVITTLTGTPSVGFACPQYVTTGVLGAGDSSLAYRPSGIVVVNAVTIATIAAYVAGNRIGVAIDPANRLVWFRVNGGNWNNSATANPATGTEGIDYSAMRLSTLWGAIYASLTGNVWTMTFTAPFTDAAPAGFVSIDTVVVSRANTTDGHEPVPPGSAAVTGPAAVASSLPDDRAAKHFSPAGALTFVRGTIKEIGVAVAGKRVDLYDRWSGELIEYGISEGDGSYEVCAVGRSSVRVVASDPTTYNSFVFDNVAPVV